MRNVSEFRADTVGNSGNRGSFPGLKRPGRGVDHQRHLVPRLKKYSYTATPPLGVHGLF
jgi:hypothetical protein